MNSMNPCLSMYYYSFIESATFLWATMSVGLFVGQSCRKLHFHAPIGALDVLAQYCGSDGVFGGFASNLKFSTKDFVENASEQLKKLALDANNAKVETWRIHEPIVLNTE